MTKRLLPLFIVLAATTAARADAIDGDWCAPEGGKSLSIQGSGIRTPGGKQITGHYGRHSFSYIAPEGDPEPGVAIDMQLMGETRVRVMVRGGAESIWRRCPPGTS
jgi:hypothetical protein